MRAGRCIEGGEPAAHWLDVDALLLWACFFFSRGRVEGAGCCDKDARVFQVTGPPSLVWLAGWQAGPWRAHEEQKGLGLAFGRCMVQITWPGPSFPSILIFLLVGSQSPHACKHVHVLAWGACFLHM